MLIVNFGTLYIYYLCYLSNINRWNHRNEPAAAYATQSQCSQKSTSHTYTSRCQAPRVSYCTSD